MPIDRFFFEDELQQGTTIALTGAENHHLSRVMRVALGESVEIINGKGSLAKAKVMEIRKDSAILYLHEVKTVSASPPRFKLVIPSFRPSKLEWIVEKGTEIGADVFLIFAADLGERAVLSTNHFERLHNIIIAAGKQSGRLFLPGIELFPSLEKVILTHEANSHLFFGDLRAEAPNILKIHPGRANIFITGPERGFSDRELLFLLSRNAKGVKLGPYVLRAETAPLVGLSMLVLGTL